MDPTAFLALVERCTPDAPAQPLAAIVREASGFEPLAIRADGDRPVALQGTSRADAIELATEFVIAGYRVRVGLAQIDTRDLDALGLTLADGFDPCINIQAAVQLVAADPARLMAPGSSGEDSQPAEDLGRDSVVSGVESPQAAAPRPAWDVYGRTRNNSVLVYEQQR